MNEIRDRAFTVARDNGFYNAPTPSNLMMGVSDELQEAWRAKLHIETPIIMDYESLVSLDNYDLINDSIEMEFIDARMRLLSLAGYLDVDLDNLSTHQDRLINVACEACESSDPVDFMWLTLGQIYGCTTYKYKQIEISGDNLIVPIVMIEKYLSIHGIDVAELTELKLKHNKTRGYLHGK